MWMNAKKDWLPAEVILCVSILRAATSASALQTSPTALKVIARSFTVAQIVLELTTVGLFTFFRLSDTGRTVPGR